MPHRKRSALWEMRHIATLLSSRGVHIREWLRQIMVWVEERRCNIESASHGLQGRKLPGMMVIEKNGGDIVLVSLMTLVMP